MRVEMVLLLFPITTRRNNWWWILYEFQILTIMRQSLDFWRGQREKKLASTKRLEIKSVRSFDSTTHAPNQTHTETKGGTSSVGREYSQTRSRNGCGKFQIGRSHYNSVISMYPYQNAVSLVEQNSLEKSAFEASIFGNWTPPIACMN